VNNFVIRQDIIPNDKQINIPVQLTWDYLGMDMSVDEYESQVITEVIGVGRDFEVSRFSHAPATGTTDNTQVNYEFYFYSGGSLDDITNWRINYISEGFTPQEIFYFSNDFSNSFFKLDLYDTPDEKKQKNYITIIIPTQQGLKMETQMQRTNVSIKKPKFVLDFIGDKEGFFIYWLKGRTFLDIDTFYMTAKFYNAKTGQFTKMITGHGASQTDLTNGPQAYLPSIGQGKYNFDNTQYFYYTVKLDYESQTYQIFNTHNQRLGTNIPIKWYEYVNPPQ
jgi:hypothetical protein